MLCWQVEPIKNSKSFLLARVENMTESRSSILELFQFSQAQHYLLIPPPCSRESSNKNPNPKYFGRHSHNVIFLGPKTSRPALIKTQVQRCWEPKSATNPAAALLLWARGQSNFQVCSVPDAEVLFLGEARKRTSNSTTICMLVEFEMLLLAERVVAEILTIQNCIVKHRIMAQKCSISNGLM